MGKPISRRTFLKHAGATAALLGLSEAMVPQIARALEELASGKPPVLWLQGQGCSGCSVSVLNTNYPGIAELVLDTLSIRFQPTIMAASGYQATEVIDETIKSLADKFVLVVEGSIPTKQDGEYCTVGLEKGSKDVLGMQMPKDKPLTKWMEEVIPAAAAVIAIGTCASFGGIPAANAKVTGATTARDMVAKIDSKKPVINVPGCAPHPDWFVGTVLDALLYLSGKKKNLQPLDSELRPKAFFGQLIHENCERRASFDAGLFLEDWNDYNPDMKLCLFKMGCRGPVTYADCPTRRWNSKVNWCVGANAPCTGCCSPDFYAGLSPLYEPLPDINYAGIAPELDKLGFIATGATAVGIGAHYLYKQLGKKATREGGE